MCTPLFLAALFTIAKTWKQPKCPLTDDWIKKMWYTYKLYCVVYTTEQNIIQLQKKNEKMPFVKTWTHQQIIILNEGSRSQVPHNVIYMWNLKYDTNELIYKTETDPQTQVTNLWLPKGKVWRDKLAAGDQQIQLLCIKQINRVLLYSTGNYIQAFVITIMEKNMKKNICIYN